MTKIVVTGGCGFIGHHFVEHLLKNTNWEIVIFDKLTYASSGFDRLRAIEAIDSPRVSIFSVDLDRPVSIGVEREVGHGADYLVHMAAETHVDNSIRDPAPFVVSNVIGTMNIMEYARRAEIGRFLYFSTDEVFGPAPVGTQYKEWDRYHSSNPYAASKAGAEELCLAYVNTYGLPAIITHTMNVFGERQHHEKFIPLVISSVLQGKEVTIHADVTKSKAGSRFYIHARNVAHAIVFLLEHGIVGDKYNIVGEKEVDNLEMARFIATEIGYPLRYKMTDFHSSRPGHDLRYALDGEKMANCGWMIPMTFEESLKAVIHWTLQHPQWLGLKEINNDHLFGAMPIVISD